MPDRFADFHTSISNRELKAQYMHEPQAHLAQYGIPNRELKGGDAERRKKRDVKRKRHLK